MTHPHDQAPAPLTAEVVADAVAALSKSALWAADNNHAGVMQACDRAAHMLTAISAGNIQPHPHDPTWAQEVEYLSQRISVLRASEAALATQLAERDAELARVTAQRDDCREAYEDTKRLARLIDVALHGEDGAAKQACLCDLVHPAATLTARIAALTEAASRVLHDIDDLVANSEGVTGLHQNGDVAEWADILEGGSFEAWLRSVETLRAALTTDKEPTT